MKRIYSQIITEHFQEGEEALFFTGPRQVGKTTIAQQARENYQISAYLNWDDLKDRRRILENKIDLLSANYLEKSLLIYDEIHKFKEWKSYIKGIVDNYKNQFNVIVTGSAHLNVYRRGGDSMMGRYFLWRVNPISVAEILSTTLPVQEIRPPQKIDEEIFENLLTFGGFPRPFLAANTRTYNRWVNQRLERLIEEDLRDSLKIFEIQKMQVLAQVLMEQAGQLISYTNLSKIIQVSDQTIRHWISVLESFYFCFSIRPWSSNISRSLLKNPKVYLYDWSTVHEEGFRYENFIAVHLLKAIQFWTDFGFGQYELFYLRDKDRREVDFLVTKDKKPWIMVEVKSNHKEPLSQNLIHFQKQLNVPHVFQVTLDADYVDRDCFQAESPVIVPAKTFLSQLI
jgi:predicted AAA+ superfamily ATPase